MTASNTIAYLAGFFDGEGNISIGPHSSKSKKRYPSSRFALHVTVANTDVRPLALFSETFGGEVKERKGSRKRLFAWNIHGHKAAKALHMMEPFLYAKKEQCNAALFFAETMQNTAWNTIGGKGNLGCRHLKPEGHELRALSIRGFRQAIDAQLATGTKWYTDFLVECEKYEQAN